MKIWQNNKNFFCDQIINNIDNGNFIGSLDHALNEINGDCDF